MKDYFLRTVDKEESILRKNHTSEQSNLKNNIITQVNAKYGPKQLLSFNVFIQHIYINWLILESETNSLMCGPVDISVVVYRPYPLYQNCIYKQKAL